MWLYLRLFVLIFQAKLPHLFCNDLECDYHVWEYDLTNFLSLIQTKAFRVYDSHLLQNCWLSRLASSQKQDFDLSCLRFLVLPNHFFDLHVFFPLFARWTGEAIASRLRKAHVENHGAKFVLSAWFRISSEGQGFQAEGESASARTRDCTRLGKFATKSLTRKLCFRFQWIGPYPLLNPQFIILPQRRGSLGLTLA